MLATRLEDGLGGIAGITVRTPRDEQLSAGLVCCDVPGSVGEDVVPRLREEHGGGREHDAVRDALP